MAISLNTLIEALANAVLDAQDRIDQHQTAHLSEYFDEDNRPKSVTIRLPSLNPKAQDGDEDLYRAPLLSLVATNTLRIKDVEISFDADLGELTTPDGDLAVPGKSNAGTQARADSPAWTHAVPARPCVNIDPKGVTSRQGQGSTHIVLRVEGAEPTDGAARLINHLAQTQGVFKTLKGESSEDE